VAEAVARQIDNVEARAAIAFARGLAVYQEGQIGSALSELTRAEELYRNHCRGGSYEMRVSRMVIAHLSLAIARTVDETLLREWLRDAEEHGDRVSTARLRFCAACAMLGADQAPQAMAQIEQAVAALGDRLEGTTATAEAMARAQIELYRGNADGALACFYVLEEFFTTALSQVRLWRGLGLLTRARLALLARAGSTTLKGLREQAESAVADTDKLDLACLSDDVHLVRAAIFAAHGKREAAIAELDIVLAAYPDVRSPPLAALFALRAKGQALGGATGKDLIARADAMIHQRHIANPRRFARLFVPGLEEAFER
jgi:tetratricopeptide (TPR) repeat protein